MYQHKVPEAEQGFSLAEVLVAVLITTLFTVTALQAMALAVLFKVRARASSEAITRIQQDVELVKAAAVVPSLYTEARCTATTYANGYAQALQNSITTTFPQTYTVGGENYTLTRTFGNTSPFNTLKITYLARKGTSASPIGSPVAQSYTEVIPDAAFQCQ